MHRNKSDKICKRPLYKTKTLLKGISESISK